jgi:methylphosphotriester-DNA--protein-cysteine methyltransferase
MSISTTLIERAEIRFQEAANALRQYVGCFWVVTAECGGTIRVVPDGTTAISIERQTSGYSEWFLRGPLLRPDERRFTAPTTLIGVRLRPGVAFMLSGIAAHSMVDRRICLSRCAPFRDLVSIDFSEHTSSQCIETLQGFLINRLENSNVDSIVATALAEIDGEYGSQRVADIAARCGVSARHLNRLMRQWVGYGPKRYAGIVRFQETLMQMEQAPEQSVALLASGSGYFDQAHLTIDVGRFAGETPGHLMSHDMSDFSKTRCDDLL